MWWQCADHSKSMVCSVCAALRRTTKKKHKRHTHACSLRVATMPPTASRCLACHTDTCSIEGQGDLTAPSAVGEWKSKSRKVRQRVDFLLPPLACPPLAETPHPPTPFPHIKKIFTC
eukprot:TRINITY_DN76398_c0_g1_i1.p1 TRINITY_DN76398_c0_g1~~TRINITY_DN76398_c0_g1_i1.p1  ORF type:complete len:117 (-),score=4.71 TRINITY_DN76398_c0_g1_i1:330-680(-)